MHNFTSYSASGKTVVLILVGVLIIRGRAIEMVPTPFTLGGRGDFYEGGWRGQSILKP